MWSAWFEMWETLALAYAEAGEFGTTREIAHGTVSAANVRPQA